MIIFVSPVCVNILNFTVISHPDLPSLQAVEGHSLRWVFEPV
jgi:hypothetical protein